MTRNPEKEPMYVSWESVKRTTFNDGEITLYLQDTAIILDRNTVTNIADLEEREYFREDMEKTLENLGYKKGIPGDLKESILDRYIELRSEESTDSGTEYPVAWFEIMEEAIEDYAKDLEPYKKDAVKKSAKSKTHR